MHRYLVTFTVEAEIGPTLFELSQRQEYVAAESPEKAALFVDKRFLRQKGRRRGKINSIEEIETAVHIGNSFTIRYTPHYTTTHVGSSYYVGSSYITYATPQYTTPISAGTLCDSYISNSARVYNDNTRAS